MNKRLIIFSSSLLLSMSLFMHKESRGWNPPEVPQTLEDTIARQRELNNKKDQIEAERKRTGKSDIIEDAKILVEEALLDIVIFQKRLEEIQDNKDANALEEQMALRKMIKEAEQTKETEMRLIKTFSEPVEQSYYNKENIKRDNNAATSQQPETKALLQKRRIEDYTKSFLKDTWNDLLGKNNKGGALRSNVSKAMQSKRFKNLMEKMVFFSHIKPPNFEDRIKTVQALRDLTNRLEQALQDVVHSKKFENLSLDEQWALLHKLLDFQQEKIRTQNALVDLWSELSMNQRNQRFPFSEKAVLDLFKENQNMRESLAQVVKSADIIEAIDPNVFSKYRDEIEQYVTTIVEIIHNNNPTDLPLLRESSEKLSENLIQLILEMQKFDPSKKRIDTISQIRELLNRIIQKMQQVVQTRAHIIDTRLPLDEEFLEELIYTYLDVEKFSTFLEMLQDDGIDRLTVPYVVKVPGKYNRSRFLVDGYVILPWMSKKTNLSQIRSDLKENSVDLKGDIHLADIRQKGLSARQKLDELTDTLSDAKKLKKADESHVSKLFEVLKSSEKPSIDNG